MELNQSDTAAITRGLQILKSAQQRKAMYLRQVTTVDAENFLAGFTIGCSIFGIQVPVEFYAQATQARGWRFNALGATPEMLAKGLSDEKIVEELFAIEIKAWELMLEALNPDHK
jgi:hypothetical protein